MKDKSEFYILLSYLAVILLSMTFASLIIGL